MGFLSFMNERSASGPNPSTSQEQKPETAKAMYTRQAGEEQANAKGIKDLTPDQQARLDSVKAELEKGTAHQRGANVPQQPAEGAAAPQAMRQNMDDKSTPAMSPTSGSAGQPATDKQSPANQPSEKSPLREPARTMPRPRPSWER